MIVVMAAERLQKPALLAAGQKQQKLLQQQQQQQVARSQQSAVQHQRANSGQHLLQQQQQVQPQQQVQQQQPQQSQQLLSEQYIHSELLKLQQENDRLKREMEKVAHQEILLTQLLNQCGGGGPGGPTGGGGSQATASVGSGGINGSLVGIDAFLGGQVSVKQELHGRQNSADSGLGRCGSVYTLLRGLGLWQFLVITKWPRSVTVSSRAYSFLSGIGK